MTLTHWTDSKADWTDSEWAVIYLRKSRDKKELADPDLLHKHRRELLRLTAARGHDVSDRIFEEKGSGDTLRSRPTCRQMLDLISRRPRGAGGWLWTTEVSRLTRGILSDRAQVYDTLIRPGVVHCTRDRDYDLAKAGDLYYWETETAAARRELGVYRERVEAARLDMALEARLPTGHPPMGWFVDRNLLNADGSRGVVQTDPLKFPIVQAICREALHLSTYQLGAKYGVDPGTVLYLLRNPFVCGYPCRRWFPHHGEKLRQDTGEEWQSPSHRAPRDRWIWPHRAGDYEPACTREEWDAIQAVLDVRSERRCKTTGVNGWCRDVVRFAGQEGHARLTTISARGYRYPYYELSVPRQGRTVYRIRREPVHQAAQEAICRLLADPDALRRGLDRYQAARRPTAAVGDADALHAEGARLERLLDALLDRELRAADAGDLREVESASRQRQQYKAALAEAEQRAKALAAGVSIDRGVEDLALLLRDVDADLIAGAWERLDDLQRRQVTAGLIEAISCRVEPVPGRVAWLREVEEVRLKAFWLPGGLL